MRGNGVVILLPVFNEGFKGQVLLIESCFGNVESSYFDVDVDGKAVQCRYPPHIGVLADIRSTDPIQKVSIALSLRISTQKRVPVTMNMA